MFPVLFTLAWITNTITTLLSRVELCRSVTPFRAPFPQSILCSHLFPGYSDEFLSFCLCCTGWRYLKRSHCCSQPVSSLCEMLFVAVSKSFVSLPGMICSDGSERCCRPVRFCLQLPCCAGLNGQVREEYVGSCRGAFLAAKDSCPPRAVYNWAYVYRERLKHQKRCSSRPNLPKASYSEGLCVLTPGNDPRSGFSQCLQS